MTHMCISVFLCMRLGLLSMFAMVSLACTVPQAVPQVIADAQAAAETDVGATQPCGTGPA